MRLLIIEDDERVRWLLQRTLQKYYAVEAVATGQDGLFRATQNEFDAILLDLNLPDIPGTRVCHELRQAGHAAPILILTGQTDRSWIARLLDAGADDYLFKPFQLDELLARLRAVIRRSHTDRYTNLLRVGDLSLDSARRSAWRQNRTLPLRRKEFDLLEYFMYNPGQTLTRAMILEHVWSGSEELWGNVVDVHVNHLRNVVDRPFAEALIQTVRGVGYKLEVSASVHEAEGVVATTS